MSVFKRCTARLPARWQAELKRMHFGRQIARNEFTTSEVEFSMLAKIGAQGHEAHVLAGMWALIDRFKPVLIVETGAVVLMDELKTHGYRADRAPGSSNVVFRPL